MTREVCEHNCPYCEGATKVPSEKGLICPCKCHGEPKELKPCQIMEHHFSKCVECYRFFHSFSDQVIKIGEEKNKEIERRDALIGKLVEALKKYDSAYGNITAAYYDTKEVINEARKFQEGK